MRVISYSKRSFFPEWLQDPELSAFVDRVRMTDTQETGALKNTGFFVSYIGAYMVPIKMMLRSFENDPTGVALLWAKWFELYETTKLNIVKAVAWIKDNSSIVRV